MNNKKTQQSSNFRKIFYFAVILTATWIIYGKIVSLTTEPPGPAEIIPKVSVKETKITELPATVTTSGILKAKGTLTLTSRAAGAVTSINIKAGDKVKSGDILLIVDDHGKKAAVESAREALNEKTKLYEINKELSDMGYYAKTSFYEKRTKLAEAKAAYETAQANYKDTMTIAPFDAYIASVEPDPKEIISVGSPVVTLFPLAHFKVNLFLSSKDVMKVSLGSPAKIILPNGKKVKGVVTKAEVRADPSNNMYEVNVGVATADNEGEYPYKMLGSPARVIIEADPVLGLEIPGSSLSVSDEGVVGIKIVDESNKAKFIPINIEHVLKSSFVVTTKNDLPSEKITLITRGADFVRDGAEVIPVKDSE